MQCCSLQRSSTRCSLASRLSESGFLQKPMKNRRRAVRVVNGCRTSPSRGALALRSSCCKQNVGCCYSPRHVLDALVAPAVKLMWLRLIGCDVAAACRLVGQTLTVRALASAFMAASSFLHFHGFYVDVVGLASSYPSGP